MRVYTTRNIAQGNKIAKHILIMSCMLSLTILYADASNATAKVECSWELNVLGESSDTVSEQAVSNSKSNLLLGIVYKQSNAQYNNFYAFVTSSKYDIADNDVINQLSKINPYPLQTIVSKSQSSIEYGFYKIENNKRPDSIIYLITAVDKIAPLERIGARISPLVNNQKLRRRGGSDFSGRLNNSQVEISSVAGNSIPGKDIQICSYMLN